ncbi:phosphoribosyl-dephospho-CoA transferase (holo-ACP synthetase) [Agrilactobacillus composti DSM 18527 = JCM 14202]|uniref:citrate lyase holo-[acyl-carrier protein] synthase n=2 Tax=Agrilactobacillus TaxID=2767875 RepID=A0A0R1XJV3_9LACO|nr:phosphoribosyl-dephospho-CoA transferase (holo-ACP synthetase) [Agrilactobacillus composti DSM 18527 = JCM 14202]
MKMVDIFTTGVPQDILAVLNNRDQRAALQAQLLQQYPTATVVAIKLNIPGPLKNNAPLKQLFQVGFTQFNQTLTSQPLDKIAWDKPTGCETFLVLTTPYLAVKQLAVNFEDEFTLGRLFDIDVLSAAFGTRAISRSDLGAASRRCFICGRPAKDCARSRRHSVPELQAKISQMYTNFFKTTSA